MCKRELDAPDDHPWRPFCSSNCKKADLGNWLNGAYRLPRPLEAEEYDQLEALDAEQQDDGRRTN